MNWKEINNNYPTAWSKLVEFHNKNENVGLIDHPDIWFDEGLDSWESRHLYDFFDENEIYIRVSLKESYKIPKKINWLFYILYFDQLESISNKYGSYDSRGKAEIALFTKAFEILESKL